MDLLEDSISSAQGFKLCNQLFETGDKVFCKDSIATNGCPVGTVISHGGEDTSLWIPRDPSYGFQRKQELSHCQASASLVLHPHASKSTVCQAKILQSPFAGGVVNVSCKTHCMRQAGLPFKALEAALVQLC